MNKGVSVILCCYNSEKRLPSTIEHLAKQTVPADYKWELIIVNNNSSDNTVKVARNEWEKYKVPINFQIIDETTPGLSHARKKGIEVSKYEYLLFCDDDNWLCDTYVQTAYEIMEEHEGIGGLGGWCEAEFETEEPEWFDTFKGNFAVGKTSPKTGFIKEAGGYLYGAGLIVSKSAIEDLGRFGFRNILSDRKGKKLSSGGDVELVYALKLLGYTIYFDDRLFFIHYMPASRLTFAYLKKIRKSMYYSNFILGIYRDQLNGIANDVTYIVKRYLKTFYKDVPFLIKDYYKANKSEKLFVLNQVFTKIYFLFYPIKYYTIRKYLSALQNEH